MTEEEDEAIGREAITRAAHACLRKARPDVMTWPAREREVYAMGWDDAMLCAAEIHAELYRRFQPDPPESMN